MPRTFRIRVLLSALVAALAVTILPASAAVSAAPTTPSVAVTGAVGNPLRLSSADLKKLPSHTVPVVYGTSKGTEAHIFRGPLLYDLARQAKPTFNPAAHNDQLRFVVLATAPDDYHAVVSWGEIDPQFANQEILVAHTQDGKPLNRPRLVVPGDDKGGRYVSDLVTLKVVGVG